MTTRQLLKETFLTKEEIFVSKKTGKIYLLKQNEVGIDIEHPVERNLSEYKSMGGNNIFAIYEKQIRKRWDGKPIE